MPLKRCSCGQVLGEFLPDGRFYRNCKDRQGRRVAVYFRSGVLVCDCRQAHPIGLTAAELRELELTPSLAGAR